MRRGGNNGNWRSLDSNEEVDENLNHESVSVLRAEVLETCVIKRREDIIAILFVNFYSVCLKRREDIIEKIFFQKCAQLSVLWYNFVHLLII
jgi:hypothetical protein